MTVRLDHTEAAYRREQLVYETYDLLVNDERCTFNGTEIALKFPSDINNLSKILLRVFMPKKQPLLDGYRNASNECTLKPYVFKRTDNALSDFYAPNSQLYASDSSGILSPITESYSFSVPFTKASGFAQLVNDTIENIMSRFDRFAFGQYDNGVAKVSYSPVLTAHDLVTLDDAAPPQQVTCKPIYLSGDNGSYLLLWVLDLHVKPLDIYYISEFMFASKFRAAWTALPNQDQYTLNIGVKANNYQSLYNKFIGASDNYDLILASPYMKNLSHIVYVQGYQPSVTYKQIEVNPAQQVISLRLMDNDQRVLTRDEVMDVYSNVWVSIDYVFSNFIN